MSFSSPEETVGLIYDDIVGKYKLQLMVVTEL